MYLRDGVPSAGEAVARHPTAHLVGIVIFSVVLNITVATHLIEDGLSSTWIGLQIACFAVLVFAIGGLIWVMKKHPFRQPD
jgi:hypothetical protein